MAEIYALSLHDALPISNPDVVRWARVHDDHDHPAQQRDRDRKSTRLNSSHTATSYAVLRSKKTTREAADRHVEQELKPVAAEVHPLRVSGGQLVTADSP